MCKYAYKYKVYCKDVNINFLLTSKMSRKEKKIKIRPKHEQNLTLCILSWPAVLRDPRFAARWLNAH